MFVAEMKQWAEQRGTLLAEPTARFSCPRLPTCCTQI